MCPIIMLRDRCELGVGEAAWRGCRPIVQQDCCESRCAWWHVERQACAHLVMAQEAERQTVALNVLAEATVRAGLGHFIPESVATNLLMKLP